MTCLPESSRLSSGHLSVQSVADISATPSRCHRIFNIPSPVENSPKISLSLKPIVQGGGGGRGGFTPQLIHDTGIAGG